MNHTWRDIARPVIQKILLDTAGMDDHAIKKALFDAYPFGERQYHPYKVWLSEIKVQRKMVRFGHRREQTKLFE